MKKTELNQRATEAALTIDWFYGKSKHHWWRQLMTTLVMWVLMLVPLIFIDELRIYQTRQGVWQLFKQTVQILGTYSLFFAAFFLLLFVYGTIRRQRDLRQQLVLAQTVSVKERTELAENLYTQKYGTADFRKQQQSIVIRDYSEIETYELRQYFQAMVGDDDVEF